MIDPSTWPEQGSLASAGEWDALQALQDELKGGRRGWSARLTAADNSPRDVARVGMNLGS
jgi:hypothetical protein